mmetsp:Transcript_17397/g.14114  ORF Transcript_17397/g.14114 Transcript_17397/m.14114 type:complete len:121 (-) Transcript_17397:73-435(-)
MSPSPCRAKGHRSSLARPTRRSSSRRRKIASTVMPLRSERSVAILAQAILAQGRFGSEPTSWQCAPLGRRGRCHVRPRPPACLCNEGAHSLFRRSRSWFHRFGVHHPSQACWDLRAVHPS